MLVDVVGQTRSVRASAMAEPHSALGPNCSDDRKYRAGRKEEVRALGGAGATCCAWIILHKGETADEKEMRAFGNASIARHKVPRYFLFVNEFPMNAAGKILKYKMREESAERLGLKKN